MNNLSDVYDSLLAKFLEFAKLDENIRAVAVMGSRARSHPPADKWSDLDLVILVNDFSKFMEDQSWAEVIGPRIFTVNQRNPNGQDGQVKVLFEGGYDIDFAASSVEAVFQLAKDDPFEFSSVGNRGFRYILDKDNLEYQFELLEVELPKYRHPSSTDFSDVVSDFWFRALWTAKHLRRGGLWYAKSFCDGYLKDLLLKMLEYHTRAIRGLDTDTWMRGRYLEEWADPRAVHELSQAYAHYDREDVWFALRNTMNLFQWIAIETAEELDYAYPHESEQYVIALIDVLYSKRFHSEK